MKTNIKHFLAITLLSTVCIESRADDWSQWRGENRDGKSAETGLLDSWPEAGPKLLWQTNDLGGGYSTPSAANGSVYLIASQGSDFEELVSLSLTDGSVQWKTKIGSVGVNKGPQYPGSRSTPSIVDGELFALGSAVTWFVWMQSQVQSSGRRTCKRSLKVVQVLGLIPNHRWSMAISSFARLEANRQRLWH